jgi:hypothetical protein
VILQQIKHHSPQQEMTLISWTAACTFRPWYEVHQPTYLNKHVAGWKSHELDISWVPYWQYDVPVIQLCPHFMNNISQPVKSLASVVGMPDCVPILRYYSIEHSNINLKETSIHPTLKLATSHNTIALWDKLQSCIILCEIGINLVLLTSYLPRMFTLSSLT